MIPEGNGDLQPSKLGTKQHWDDVYSAELENFEENGDEGEVWFGEESVDKMVDWAVENVPPSAQPTILEIGSGNGALLFALQEADYDARSMAGLDYSLDAVKLARSIGTTRGRGAEDITFAECNFLSEDFATPKHISSDVRPAWGGWDLVLDKGTYDAIALGEKDASGKSPVAEYPARLLRLLRAGGLYLITSCNFTEDELKHHFMSVGLTYHSRVEHRTFTFGGQKGNVVSTVAFQKTMPQ